jgi:hypothetical protein
LNKLIMVGAIAKEGKADIPAMWSDPDSLVPVAKG